MTSVTGLDGSVTRYEYDALGRRTLTAGGNLTTEYEYDEVGSVLFKSQATIQQSQMIMETAEVAGELYR